MEEVAVTEEVAGVFEGEGVEICAKGLGLAAEPPIEGLPVAPALVGSVVVRMRGTLTDDGVLLANVGVYTPDVDIARHL